MNQQIPLLISAAALFIGAFSRIGGTGPDIEPRCHTYRLDLNDDGHFEEVVKSCVPGSRMDLVWSDARKRWEKP